MKKDNSKISKSYLLVVLLLMFVIPVLSIIIEYSINKQQVSIINLCGKWFLFWGIGIRLFTAGFKQALNPSFTAQSIFHIQNEESFVLVKELGIANICLGSIGIISLFCPEWRMAAAFAGGLYMGIAGINHIIKKPASANEWLAMVSDIFIFVVMMIYIIGYYITQN
jgi:hypothetical protein